MRRMKYLIFTLIFSLVFVGSVVAKEYTCTYQQGHNQYTITYDETNGVKKIIKTNDTNPDGVDATSTYKNTFKSIIEDGDCINEVEFSDGTTAKLIKDGKVVSSDSDSDSDSSGTCASFKNENSCKNSTDPKCVWNSEYGFCNVNTLVYLKCGDAKDIPSVVPKLTSYAVNLLKIVTPIILILVGIIELVKAMASSNEDSMKKAQSKLIKKVAAAVMVFFVITIVQFIVLKVADSGEKGSIRACLKCFLNNECGSSVYYKDGYGQEYSVED